LVASFSATKSCSIGTAWRKEKSEDSWVGDSDEFRRVMGDKKRRVFAEVGDGRWGERESR